MRFQALKDFLAKNGNRAIEIKAGQMITLPDDKAKALLAKGLIEPEQKTEATTKPFCFWLDRETEKHNEGGICCSSHTSCPNWKVYWERRKAELKLLKNKKEERVL